MLLSVSVKGVLDLHNALVAEVGEKDGVGTLRDWVALVVLASKDAGEGHAGWWHTLNKNA